MWAEFFTPEIEDVFACITTIGDPINKRRPRGDSAHQIGLKPALHAVTDCRLVMLYKEVKKPWAEFLSGNLGPCCLKLKNHKYYGKMETTVGFCSLNRSRNHL